MALPTNTKTAAQLAREKRLAELAAMGVKGGSGGDAPPPVRQLTPPGATSTAPISPARAASMGTVPTQQPGQPPAPPTPVAPVTPVTPVATKPPVTPPYTPSAGVADANNQYLQVLGQKPGAYTPQNINPYAPYAPYQPSDAVKGLYDQMSAVGAQRPGAYNNKYQPNIDQLFAKMMDRGDFKYDINADTLYKQAADRFTQQAKMGLMDTMGQAQAMTGGYGNTWAQTAGQQTYDRTMQGLTDMIPQLEQRAYARWQGEGDEMARQMAMAQSLEQTDYGRYRDQMGDWRMDEAQAYDRFNTERGFDYGQYSENRALDLQMQQDNRNFDYGRFRDQMGDYRADLAQARDQYNAERNFDYGKFADDRALDLQMQRDNRDFGYGQYRDQMTDWNAMVNRALAEKDAARAEDYTRFVDNRDFEYGNLRDQEATNFQREQWDYKLEQDRKAEELAAQARAAAGSGGGGGGSSRGGGSSGSSGKPLTQEDIDSYNLAVENGTVDQWKADRRFLGKDRDQIFAYDVESSQLRAQAESKQRQQEITNAFVNTGKAIVDGAADFADKVLKMFGLQK